MAEFGAYAAAYAESVIDLNALVCYHNGGTADLHAHPALGALVLIRNDGRFMLDIFEKRAGTSGDDDR